MTDDFTRLQRQLLRARSPFARILRTAVTLKLTSYQRARVAEGIREYRRVIDSMIEEMERPAV